MRPGFSAAVSQQINLTYYQPPRRAALPASTPMMSFHDSFGYEPNRRARGLEKRERGPLKIPSELIKVLKPLKSYAAGDRIDFKNELISMLRSCNAMYLLKNEQRDWANTQEQSPSRRPILSSFTPAPIRRVGARQLGQNDFVTPSGQRQVDTRARTARAHAHSSGSAYEHPYYSGSDYDRPHRSGPAYERPHGRGSVYEHPHSSGSAYGRPYQGSAPRHPHRRDPAYEHSQYSDPDQFNPYDFPDDPALWDSMQEGSEDSEFERKYARVKYDHAPPTGRREVSFRHHHRVVEQLRRRPATAPRALMQPRADPAVQHRAGSEPDDGLDDDLEWPAAAPIIPALALPRPRPAPLDLQAGNRPPDEQPPEAPPLEAISPHPMSPLPAHNPLAEPAVRVQTPVPTPPATPSQPPSVQPTTALSIHDGQTEAALLRREMAEDRRLMMKMMKKQTEEMSTMRAEMIRERSLPPEYTEGADEVESWVTQAVLEEDLRETCRWWHIANT